MDDLEDGFYAVADEEAVEDGDVDVEGMLQDMGLSEIIDADDVTSFALAAKCTGLGDIEDISDIEDIADLQIDGAMAFQVSLADDGYAGYVVGLGVAGVLGFAAGLTVADGLGVDTGFDVAEVCFACTRITNSVSDTSVAE